jgi:PAS domain S-box-containing protein
MVQPILDPAPAAPPADGSRRRSLGQLLLALTIGTLLPVLLFAAVVSWLSAERERRVFEQGVQERTRAILTAVESELKGSITSLEALATSKALDSGDLPAFHAESVRVLRSQRDWLTVNLALPNGEQVINSMRPLGTPLGQVGDRGSFEAVLKTGAPAVGSLTSGRVVAQYNVPIRVPVVRDGAIRYVLTAALDPRSVQDLILRQGLPADWVIAVLDQSRHFVARSAEREKFLGKSPTGRFLDTISAAPEGTFNGVNAAGTRVYSSYARSAAWGWTVSTGVPAATVESGAGYALALMFTGTVVVLLLAFVIARLLARRIAAPIADLAGAARSLAQGQQPAALRLPDVREFVELGRAFEQAGATLAARDEAQSRFAAVAQNATVAIFLTDLEKRCIFMNPAAEQMTGYTFAEARDRPLREVIGYDAGAADRSRPGSSLTVALAGDAPCSGDDWFVDRTGRRFPVAYACGPIRKGGVVSGMIIEARDITATRLADAERAALLEGQTPARHEAESANQAKDEFLAMLGHELRNPLGAISNATYLLERQTADAAVQGAGRVIGRQVAHVTRLVDDLLDVARVTSGKISLDIAPLNLAEIARSAVATLEGAGRTAQRALTADLQTVWVDGDQTRLEQIVNNLLGNALRYTSAGGNISIALARQGADAVLTVTDDGIGIPAAVLPRIFDLFFQGENSIDRTHGGLGIGLTLVRRLVELHGGSISAASPGHGQGSTFTVRLPARDAAPAVAAPPGPGAPTEARRILLIEDNADVRDMMVAVLAAHGHEVYEAEDGQGGVDLARATLPDVALIDIGLPGLTGYEVASALRADARTAPMKLIALTGYGQPKDARQAHEAGFDLHITKPVDIERILALLAQYPRVPLP